MKLQIKKRSGEKKSETNGIRRAGNIPAVIYSKGQKGEPVAVDGADFSQAMRQMKKGHLPTTVFELALEGAESRKVIVKGIDYHPTTYQVLHLDLMELHAETPVVANVPIIPTGVMDCVGIKLGGVLRQVIRHLKVRCLPQDLPSSFELDVRELKLKQTRRLKEIVVPAGVTPVVDVNEVALLIAKR